MWKSCKIGQLYHLYILFAQSCHKRVKLKYPDFWISLLHLWSKCPIFESHKNNIQIPDCGEREMCIYWRKSYQVKPIPFYSICLCILYWMSKMNNIEGINFAPPKKKVLIEIDRLKKSWWFFISKNDIATRSNRKYLNFTY